MDHAKRPNGMETVWNHTFQWTDKHFTPHELFPLRQETDDLAVAAVARLQEIIAKEKRIDTGQSCPIRFDMYSALKTHHNSDIILQQLWEEVNTVPDWVDWNQIERGQQFLYRYLAPNLFGLALQGFLGGTATIAGGTEVLVRTGGFSIRVMPKRFLETFLWLLQVTMSLDSMQPGGEGHSSTVRVRLLHATVRHRILKLIEKDPAYFDEDKHGAAVNLRDAIHATAIFCCMPLWRQLPTIGVKPQPHETEDFIALFRYIAYVMATPNTYFDSAEQAKATMESVMFCEPEPTDASKAIGMNFVTAIQDYPGINVSKPMIETGCRAMSGDELADKFGFSKPGVFYRASFRGCCTVLVAVTTLQQWIPSFDRLMIKTYKEFVLKHVFGSSLVRGGNNFEFTYVPQLSKYTKREENERPVSSAIRPVETVGFVVFLIEMLVYALLAGSLGRACVVGFFAVSGPV